jgi:hypothetical protein
MPKWVEKAVSKIKHSKMPATEKKEKESMLWATANKQKSKKIESKKHEKMEGKRHEKMESKSYEKMEHSLSRNKKK